MRTTSEGRSRVACRRIRFWAYTSTSAHRPTGAGEMFSSSRSRIAMHSVSVERPVVSAAVQASRRSSGTGEHTPGHGHREQGSPRQLPSRGRLCLRATQSAEAECEFRENRFSSDKGYRNNTPPQRNTANPYIEYRRLPPMPVTGTGQVRNRDSTAKSRGRRGTIGSGHGS